jgi:hypothetical protein
MAATESEHDDRSREAMDSMRAICSWGNRHHPGTAEYTWANR